MTSYLIKENLDKILKRYKITLEEFEKLVENVKIWYMKQPHFPNGYEKTLIEGNLVRANCQIECSQESLENFYTIRGVHKKILNSSALNPNLPSQDVLSILPLPKLNPANDRIIFVKIANPRTDLFTMDRVMEQIAILGEDLLRNDYASGILFVMDCTDFKFNHVRLVTFAKVAATFEILQDGYGLKISGIRYFNAPTYMRVIIEILKRLLSTNIMKNVKTFKGIEGLYDEKILPKECFPKDYGGQLDTVQELKGQWDQVMAKSQDELVSYLRLVADESKRLPAADPQKDEN